MVKLQQHEKVFGLGLSRTGTTSLAKALNTLEIRTIHFPRDQVTFDELRKGNYRLSILDRYQGIVDITVAPYYAQLDKVYPGSKFILTVREITSWLKSVENHWRLDQENSLHNNFISFIRACVYGTIEFNEDRFRYVYETHVRNVCDYFAHRPRDFLLVNISDGDGWEKLCPFLGLPIPDVSFPHSNKGEENRKWMQQLDLAIEDIPRLIPPGRAFILVDYGKIGSRVVLNDRRVIPFLERNGHYGGPPPDDVTAISELNRLCQAGASFLVFLWPYYWWLEHYLEFNKYLRSNFKCLVENDRLIIFDLRT